MRNPISRRRFLGQTGALASGVWVAGVQRGFGQENSPNAKLGVAFIACGGRGGANLGSLNGQPVNVVALCDVNQKAIDKAGAAHANAIKTQDFRTLWEAEKSFDAVVVSTAEHTHAFATLEALKLKKHVYCEKPLTHGVWEARVVTEAAAKANVATQMGIQNHANPNYRRVVELIRAGAIGKVSEAHVWVHRTWGWQSPEDAKTYGDIISTQERPAAEDPVPEGVDWDLFVGPAPARPFSKVYWPGPRWYRWWDFGSGTMSDLGSHSNDLPFWALDLDAPLTIEGFGPPVHKEIAPASFRATYEYGPKGDRPAVKLHWYQGALEKPPQFKEGKLPKKKDGSPDFMSGCLFVGDKGWLVADYGRHLLLPEEQFKDFKQPPETLPRVKSHHAEWVEAARSGKKSMADFAYSGPLTEANHLASIAYRVGKKLEWDAKALRATNAPEADALIKRAYRAPWVLA
jgi:predicted dehydrogenase